MSLYELSDEQIKALSIFLDRTNLKGEEALQYIMIVQALRTPVDVQKVKETEKSPKKKG